MKHILTLSLCFLALSLSVYGQSPCNNQTSITYHGDEYDLVHIGSQCWFKENLKTNRYSNGDLIPEVTSNIHWQEATNGAWCYWGNSDLNNNTYGKLYNWHVASDTRNVCPTEWEVPNKDRFDVLKEYINSLGVPVDAHGGALKEEGTTHWLAPNTGATNSTGFSSLPGGYRDDYDGNFYLIGANSYGDGVTNYNCVGYFWGSDTSDNYDSYGNALGVHNGIGSINMNIYLKDNGLSIRCVRTQINTGCMNPTASNYDPVAVEDDSSCLFIGCVDNYACNFNEYATEDDGSCDYTCCPGPGCCNIGMTWNWELGICETSIPTDSNLDGCTDLNDLMDLLAAYGGTCTNDEVNDTTPPIMLISSVDVNQGGTHDNTPVVIKFTSDEAITDFLIGDIILTNGTLGTLTGSGTDYTAEFTPTSSGPCSVAVGVGSFSDTFGNINTIAPPTFSWTFSTSITNTLYMSWSGGNYPMEKFADITLVNPDLNQDGVAETPYSVDDAVPPLFPNGSQVWVYDNQQYNPILDNNPLPGASGNNGQWNNGEILDPQFGIPDSWVNAPGYNNSDFPQNFPITLQGSPGQYVYFNTWDRYDDTWDGTEWKFTDKPTSDPTHTVIFSSQTPNGGDQTGGNSWDGNPGRLEVTYALRWWDPQPLVGGFSHNPIGEILNP